MTKKLKLLLVALVLLLPLPILALEIHNNDNVVLGTDKVIDGNYYAAGKNIDIYGTVNGNLYLAAEYINIDSSNINGDIFFVAAKDITINGKVKGSIHGVADKVNIRAQVQNNVMAFGQNINIESDAYIMQHLTVFGQRVVLDAKVGGHLEGFVESILINGQVEKNVDIHVSTGKDKNSLQISETATINGELKYKVAEEFVTTLNARYDQIKYDYDITDEDIKQAILYSYKIVANEEILEVA